LTDRGFHCVVEIHVIYHCDYPFSGPLELTALVVQAKVPLVRGLPGTYTSSEVSQRWRRRLRDDHDPENRPFSGPVICLPTTPSRSTRCRCNRPRRDLSRRP